MVIQEENKMRLAESSEALALDDAVTCVKLALARMHRQRATGIKLQS
jgi:hypothetical protein